jgi:hypothetical protein
MFSASSPQCTYAKNAGFDLLLKMARRETESFAGGVTAGDSEGFVDLYVQPDECPTAAVWSFAQIRRAVRKCLVQCEGLRAHAESTATSACDNASAQVVAVIESLVHHQLPFPDCAQAAAGRSFSWLPSPEDAPFSVDAQRSLVRAFFQLAVQYSAAVRNLPSCRAAYGARVVTIAALVVLADATCRVMSIAFSEPSAFAKVLCGGRAASGSMSDGCDADQPPVAYGISLASNATLPFEDLSAILLLVQPELLHTRQAIIRYVAHLNRGKPLLPFAFLPLGAAAGGSAASAAASESPEIMELPEEDATFQLVQDLCEATGHHNDLPRGDERAARRIRRGAMGADVPDLERRGAWFAEDWADVPEFALYRDLLLLFRLSAEPIAAAPPDGDCRVTVQSWSAATAAPKIRFLHLDFAKKNVSSFCDEWLVYPIFCIPCYTTVIVLPLRPVLLYHISV